MTDAPMQNSDTTDSSALSLREFIHVRIRCLHSTTKQFFDRNYWLELCELTKADQERVREVKSKSPVSAVEFLGIRGLFRQGDMPPLIPHQFKRYGGFSVHDYFEDELGKPLDEVGLMQVMTGQEQPIILGNVNSVLRLGPSAMHRQAEWKLETANAIAHFLQLVEIIGTGPLARTEVSISTPGGFGASEWINDFSCPDLSSVYSFLLPIRQLYSEDHAFGHAINAYLRHVADERKKAWIGEVRKSFNKYLESTPHPFMIDNLTVRQMLEVVMYGAGLIHYAKSDPQLKQRFREVISHNHRETIIFAFLMCCHHLYCFAAQAYYVLLQDFRHWTDHERHQKPDIIFLQGLFASHNLRKPNDTPN